MSLVQDDHVVEELAADRADHALGERVLPGRTRCGEDLGDADAFHPSAKLGAVDAVTITEQVARRRVIGERLDDLLRRPGDGACRLDSIRALPDLMRCRYCFVAVKLPVVPDVG